MQDYLIAFIGVGGIVLGAAVGAYLTYRLNLRQQQQLVQLSDKQLFQAWHVAFDRPVFKGPWRWHSDIEKARRAIEALIQAVNTGDIRGSREAGRGRTYLRNKEWYAKMGEVERRLNRIRILVQEVEKPSLEPARPSNEIAEEIDHERDEIIETLNEIWKSFGLEPLPKPSEEKTYGGGYE